MSERTGFGTVLRTARRARGLSQRELAQAVDLDVTYISKLENEREKAPSCRSVVRLAVALDCDPVALLRLRRPAPAALAGLSAEQWEALSDWLGAKVF